MSEDGEMWAEIRADSQKKRWENVEKSLQILYSKGFPVKVINEPTAHYRVEGWDFWPTTGKFYNSKTKQKGRGVFNLIKVIH